MNYYELIYLKNFVKDNFKGSKINLVTTAFKNVIDFFAITNHNEYKLTFSTAPGNLALFVNTQLSKRRSNRIHFFEEIYGKTITDVKLAENDRILTMYVEGGYELIFKIYGSNANVYLAHNGVLKSSFKEDDNILPVPRKAPQKPTIDDNLPIKKKITLIAPKIPRTHLNDLIEVNNLHSLTQSELAEFIQRVINQLENTPQYRLVVGNTTTIINEKLLPIKTKQQFDDINQLVEYRYKNHIYNQLLHQGYTSYKKRISRQLKRTNSSLKNLENADVGIERASLYEKYGHILMANGHLNIKGEEKIQLADLYNEGETITIPLDKTKTLIQNAERYYDKAKTSVESFETAIKRIPILEKQKERLLKLQESMDEVDELHELREWEKNNKSELESLNLNSRNKKMSPKNPFHTYHIDDYIIWIGKNAKNNDLLVKMAHKEDVWLHARGVAGSHVLIRMNNNRDLPPKEIIGKAASYAAYNSKAKGADLVPVIYTKRKFIRKPKNAAPGAVIVERENVEFVKPQNPEDE